MAEYFETDDATLKQKVVDDKGNFIRWATDAEVYGTTPSTPTISINPADAKFKPSIRINPAAANFNPAPSRAEIILAQSKAANQAATPQKPAAASGPQIQNYTETKSAIAMSAQTLKKIEILEKQNPPLGQLARMLFGGGGTSPQKFIETLQGFDKATRDRLMSLFAQEIQLNNDAAIAQGGTGLAKSSGGGGFNLGSALNPFGPTEGNRFQGVIDSVNQSVDNQITRINETFKPVSTYLGETLGNVERLINDPVGTLALIPSSIKNVIERNVSPRVAAKIEATYQRYNLDTLVHLPSIILGNLGSLISDIDALISLPFIIINDLYMGLMDIINDLADALQQIIADQIKKIFENLFDGILGELLEILQELSDLLGIIGGISSAFSGVTQFTQVLFNVQTYITQLGQFFNNPLDLMFAYAPPQVSEALYLMRNPQQLVNSILPPQLSEMFAKVSQIAGFGFNGNMGYGFVSVLQGVQGGVIASILNNFASQYPILNSILSLLNNASGMPPQNAEHPPTVTPSPVAPANDNIRTSTNGAIFLTKEQPLVIPLSKEERSTFLASVITPQTQNNQSFSDQGFNLTSAPPPAPNFTLTP